MDAGCRRRLAENTKAVWAGGRAEAAPRVALTLGESYGSWY
jgi:hypothetical protein